MTTVVCPSHGLTLAAGVTLDLGGATIGGTFLGFPGPIGLLLDTGTTVNGPGTITGFNRAVVGLPFADGITVSGVTADGSFNAGFDLFSAMNSLSGNTAVGNGNTGFLVIGTDNSVTDNVARENTGHGFSVSAANITLTGNTAELNSGIGISITGNFSPPATNNVSGNEVSGADPGPTAGPGIQVLGSGNGIHDNKVEHYETCFRIDGEMLTVTSNTAQDCDVGFNFLGDETGTCSQPTPRQSATSQRPRKQRDPPSPLASVTRTKLPVLAMRRLRARARRSSQSPERGLRATRAPTRRAASRLSRSSTIRRRSSR